MHRTASPARPDHRSGSRYSRDASTPRPASVGPARTGHGSGAWLRGCVPGRAGRTAPAVGAGGYRYASDRCSTPRPTPEAEFRRQGAYVPKLTPNQASAVDALDSHPDHIAFEALQRGGRDGRLDALSLWTTWRREQAAAPLDRRPRLSLVSEALNAGLQRRLGRRLGHCGRAAYDLLVDRYVHAEGALPGESADELGLLRVCERCDLVTRGPRNAARCRACGHRHSTSPREGAPLSSPCPVCGIRPVTDAQARCDDCKAERTKGKKAAQARRRRARRRGSTDPG